MTQPEPPPSRREFSALVKRVTAIDRFGSRPMIKLVAQVAQIARDLADLKREWEEQHKRHEERRRERTITRRWVIGTCIAAIVALVAVVTLLLTILQRVK